MCTTIVSLIDDMVGDTVPHAPWPRLAPRELTFQAQDGLALHVQVHGPDDASATVVLLHGYQLSQRLWARQVHGLHTHRYGLVVGTGVDGAAREGVFLNTPARQAAIEALDYCAAPPFELDQRRTQLALTWLDARYLDPAIGQRIAGIASRYC